MAAEREKRCKLRDATKKRSKNVSPPECCGKNFSKFSLKCGIYKWRVCKWREMCEVTYRLVKNEKCKWGWKGRYTVLCPFCWICKNKEKCRAGEICKFCGK